MSQWFVVRDGKEAGPVTGDLLRAMAEGGLLRPDDEVRRTDMSSSTKAGTLKSLFAASTLAGQPSLPPTVVAVSPEPTTKRSVTKRVAISTLAVGGVVLLMCWSIMAIIDRREIKQPGAKLADKLGASTKADAEPTKGATLSDGRNRFDGTIADFILRMRHYARLDWPAIGWLTFGPVEGSARSIVRDETEFFKRFGPPIENTVDTKKADRYARPSEPAYGERFRLWIYRCTDGTMTLHVEPTTVQSPPGSWVKVLDVTIEPADCHRR